MDDLTGPVIGITLVLMSVFIPAAFLPGLTGQIYRQFALVIAATAVISAINAMTLKPTQCALWLRKPVPPAKRNIFYRGFNRVYDLAERGYVRIVGAMIRRSGIMAVIGLALNEAAYLSEILRGGILSVAKGQTEAARALGLKPYQIFRKVVMPQALRVIIPPLGNSVNGLLKTTSIASVISMEEVLRRGQILMQQKFQVLEVFMVVAIIYLVMTTCWDFVQRRIEAYYGKAYGAAVDTQLARDDH